MGRVRLQYDAYIDGIIEVDVITPKTNEVSPTFYRKREEGSGTYELSREQPKGIEPAGLSDQPSEPPTQPASTTFLAPTYRLWRHADSTFGTIDLGHGLDLAEGKQLMNWLVHNDKKVRRALKVLATDMEQLILVMEEAWQMVE